MRAIDAETGQPFLLFATKELNDELRAFEARECNHSDLKLCIYKDAAGNTHFRRQCQSCGEMKGTAVARNAVGDAQLTEHRPNLNAEYEGARQRERDAIVQKHIRIQKAKSGAFSKAYADHLASEKWQRIRRKVLERAKNLCEGCLERAATQVHHKSYDHLGEEFMFELLALCQECHERLHPSAEALNISDDEPDQRAAKLDCQCRCSDGDPFDPKCWKFGMLVEEAISEEGPCGPRRSAREGFK